MSGNKEVDEVMKTIYKLHDKKGGNVSLSAVEGEDISKLNIIKAVEEGIKRGFVENGDTVFESKSICLSEKGLYYVEGLLDGENEE